MTSLIFTLSNPRTLFFKLWPSLLPSQMLSCFSLPGRLGCPTVYLSSPLSPFQMFHCIPPPNHHILYFLADSAWQLPFPQLVRSRSGLKPRRVVTCSIMCCLISSSFPSLWAKCNHYIVLLPAKANLDFFTSLFFHILEQILHKQTLLFDRIVSRTVYHQVTWNLDRLEPCSFNWAVYFCNNWWLAHNPQAVLRIHLQNYWKPEWCLSLLCILRLSEVEGFGEQSRKINVVKNYLVLPCYLLVREQQGQGCSLRGGEQDTKEESHSRVGASSPRAQSHGI